jgi:tripartite motif-containing protein 71
MTNSLITLEKSPTSSPGASGRIGVALLIGILALAGNPRTAGADGLADPALMITGSDPGVPFRAPEGIALDGRHGELLLAHAGAHRIDIFDFQGHSRARFIHEVTGPDGKRIEGTPVSIALDRAGHTVVTDRVAGYADVLDYRGRSVAHLDLPALGAAIFDEGPGAVTCAPDGSILVASRGDSGRVHEFAPDFSKAIEWGSAGTGPGQLSRIAGLAVSPGDGSVVVVCENTQYAVQVFDRRGGYLRGFGMHEIGPGNFSYPSGVTVTSDGRLWVSDAIRQNVQVFDANGGLLGAFGGPGRAPGRFTAPMAMASAGDSLLAIAERDGNRFQLMRIR